MITLYTPATGFPDLEIKIAYGLARVGIEAGFEVQLVPQKGFYQVSYNHYSSTKASDTFLMFLQRFLSADRFFDLGVKAKDKTKYSADEKIINELKRKNVNFHQIFNERAVLDFDFKRKTFCGHDKIPRFGGRSGLILLSSFHAGKPYERDKRSDTFNLGLCEICGYLAVLGLYSFGFNIQLGKGKNRKYVIVLPIPEENLSTDDLQFLLALQKTLHNFWLSDLQPLRTFFIGLLAKVPSLSDIVNELKLKFHLSLLSKDNRGDTVVEQTAFVNALPFSKFISDSPYNSATIIKLLSDSPKISSLVEITNILEYSEKKNLPKFARLYVQETSTNNYVNLLYPETAKYLLKEVGMIKEEIIKNKAVRSIAKTLGYFVWNKDHQNYSFADGLRNAKTFKDVREIFEKLIREAKLRYDQEKNKPNGNPPHLPHPDDIEQINHIMQSDEESFHQVITTLYLLAFSFESYKTIKIEPIQEVSNAIQG